MPLVDYGTLVLAQLAELMGVVVRSHVPRMVTLPDVLIVIRLALFL